MASNIMQYLSLNPASKGIFIAHNVHVSKSLFEYSDYKPKKTAGRYLFENVGDKYVNIGQTTGTGSFNAYTFFKDQYLFQVHQLKKAKSNSLEKELSRLNSTLLIFNMAGLDYKRMKYTQIGHTYGRTNEGYRVRRYQSLKEGQFDYFIYFNNTNESQVIPRNASSSK
jgi:erythromycin esterase-like protein